MSSNVEIVSLGPGVAVGDNLLCYAEIEVEISASLGRLDRWAEKRFADQPAHQTGCRMSSGVPELAVQSVCGNASIDQKDSWRLQVPVHLGPSRCLEK